MNEKIEDDCGKNQFAKVGKLSFFGTLSARGNAYGEINCMAK